MCTETQSFHFENITRLLFNKFSAVFKTQNFPHKLFLRNWHFFFQERRKRTTFTIPITADCSRLIYLITAFVLPLILALCLWQPWTTSLLPSLHLSCY